MWPTQTTLSQGGKLVYLQEENPYSWGRKNPISNLSRIKNPDLPYLHIAAALRAYSISSSLDILNSLGTTTSLSSLSKVRVYYIPARPCQSITVYFLPLLYLNYPLCTISCLVNYCYIYYASPPLRPIKGVKGIYPF